jgi:hypothetical protein
VDPNQSVRELRERTSLVNLSGADIIVLDWTGPPDDEMLQFLPLPVHHQTYTYYVTICPFLPQAHLARSSPHHNAN